MKRFWLMMAVTAFYMAGLTGVAKTFELSNGVKWVYSSDNYKACVTQAYLDAGRRLKELAKTEKPGGWCVVLDADETIISNAAFEAEKEQKGVGHSEDRWTEWCNRAKATALPGAREFCALVKEQGGKVIIVTNRKDTEKKATLKNLDVLKFPYDVCLFKEGPYAKDRKKTMRRQDITKGVVKTLPAGTKLPPLKILMLAGDQMHDLYDPQDVSFDEVKERFGKDFVTIPNPMYGDWQ